MEKDKEKEKVPELIEKITDKTPAVKDEVSYYAIYQNKDTSTLKKIHAKDIKIDTITGKASAQKDGTALIPQTWKIPLFDEIEDTAEQIKKLKRVMRPTTILLLEFLEIKLYFTGIINNLRNKTNIVTTNNKIKNLKINISISEYMEARGLKNRKEARKNIIESIKDIYNISLVTSKGVITRVISDFDPTKRDIIPVTFAPSYIEQLKISKTVYIADSIFKDTDISKNKNSLTLALRLLEHKSMNRGKSNEDIIPVKSLLEATGYPDYNKIIKSQDRHVGRQIIDKFFEDLDKLNKFVKCDLCEKDGAKIADPQRLDSNYDTLIKLYINTSWNNYPEEEKTEKSTKHLKYRKHG